MKTIATVTVWSQLHGLSTPKSDFDRFSIVKSELMEVLWKDEWHWSHKKNLEEDDTKYELLHFLKLATKGNGTILEILHSHLIDFSDEDWQKIIDQKNIFLDKDAIYKSHIWYANSQLGQIERWTVEIKRFRKALVAYLRTLYQGIQLLETWTVEYPLTGTFKDSLWSIKNGESFSFEDYFVVKEELGTQLKEKIEYAYKNSVLKKIDMNNVKEFFASLYK